MGVLTICIAKIVKSDETIEFPISEGAKGFFGQVFFNYKGYLGFLNQEDIDIIIPKEIDDYTQET